MKNSCNEKEFFIILLLFYYHFFVVLGAKHGRRATWIGASGDQTFVRIDESLINAHTLAKSQVFANRNCIGQYKNKAFASDLQQTPEKKYTWNLFPVVLLLCKFTALNYFVWQ